MLIKSDRKTKKILFGLRERKYIGIVNLFDQYINKCTTLREALLESASKVTRIQQLLHLTQGISLFLQYQVEQLCPFKFCISLFDHKTGS